MPEPVDLGWLTARPIAHRGLHDAAAGRAENTLPAFEAAIARNFAIECDVRETADGDAVVFHDAMLDRLTAGTGSVARKRASDLKALRFKNGDGHIPTLEDVLDLVDGRVPVFIELKPDGSNGDRLAAVVAATLTTYDGPAATMAFEPGSMSAMRRAAPQIPRGMLMTTYGDADPAMSALSRFARRHLLALPFVLPQFVGCDRHAMPASVPLFLKHLLRLPLLAWTVRTAVERRAVAGWADQIIFEGFNPDARRV